MCRLGGDCRVIALIKRFRYLLGICFRCANRPEDLNHPSGTPVLAILQSLLTLVSTVSTALFSGTCSQKYVKSMKVF